MNVRTILLWGVIAVLTLLLSCQNPTGPETQVTAIPTSVRGMVIRNDNLAPITNAIVYDIGGLARDTSRSDGTFRLVYQLLSQTKTTIIGSRGGFGNDTATVTLNPGVDTTLVLRLRADSTSPTGQVSSGKAANIVLVASSSDNISIRGTGSNETALLQFEVRDSLGLPIAGVNKLTINFSILGGPGGGEYVFPASAETDPLTGRVTTRVSSGTKAGVLQLYASVIVPGTPPLSIKSSPIRITISGGLPDENHFSISRKPLNIAGGVYDNLRAQIMVVVGDKEGNPVQPGTAVSFITTGGVIQPNALTDKDGIASVDLISSNPRPLNSIAIVTAKTIGDSGKVIQKSTVVLFSGATRILTPASTIVIPDSGVASFEYRVQDPNGSPLAGGTNISLSVDGPGSGQLELSGDVTKTLEDSNDPNSTLFKETVRDKQFHGPAGAVTFKIAVTSQNGNASATFPGNVLVDTNVIVPASKSGYISSLTLVGIDNTQLSISGTGANEIAKLTFIAKDSLGNPVELRKRAYITFSLSPTGGVGGGEFLFPAADSTDAQGQVSTTFNAGTRSGVLQVIARAVASGRNVTSSPIRITIAGGLPDSNRFTASLSQANMPGLIKSGAIGTVNVQVGDKFGNPVQPGTALYFSTSGGLIQAASITDVVGLATATIQGGNPAPNEPSIGGPGHGFITVQTVGSGGLSIQKKIPFLFTGETRVVTPSSNIFIPDSGTATFQYRVQDINGNPLVAGTTISLNVDGPGSGFLELSGDISKTLLDSADPSTTLFTATVRDKVLHGPAGAVTFHLSVTSPNGNATANFAGTVTLDTTSVPNVPASPPTTGYASSLLMVGQPVQNVSVRGTGASEISTITFVALDSVGNAVETRRKAYVRFSITPTGGLGGGEFLYPAADSTNSLGQVTTTFNSGTRSGVLQIVAQAVVNGRTITSSPIKMTVSSGLPDLAHFTAAISTQNMAGWNTNPGSVVGTVSVQVGDKFGNPVQSGTALYFTTTGGIIHPTAFTNPNGQAVDPLTAVPAISLYGGNPFPSDNGVAGLGHVTISTVGEGGISISKSIPFLFSGAPIVTLINVPTDTVRIFDGGSVDVSYKVADINGNPVSSGQNISVAVSGPGASGVTLTGDVNVLTPDTQDKVNFTHYSFRVTDRVPNGDPSGDLVFTITVTGPSGTFVQKFYGVLYSPQVSTTVPPSARQPAQIALLPGSPTTPDIYVAGVGNVENTVITYQVNDSLGIPIDKSRRTYATYSLQFAPNSFTGGGSPPTIIPAADSTDDLGKLRISIVSGTEAGVITLKARIILAGGTIIESNPVKITVHAGYADQRHFSLIPGRYVFPSFDALNQVGFTVVVGDTFSNPVQAGTAIYFNSQAGVMQTGSSTSPLSRYTDGTGTAGATLFTVNPLPNAPPFEYIPGPGDPYYFQMGAGSSGGQRAGFHWVWASTQGKGGARVGDSVLVCWNKAPITFTGIPGAIVHIPRAGTSAPISMTIKDANGNPLADGTTITVSVIYTTDVVGISFGVFGGLSTGQFLMPNAAFARFTGPGTTDFTFSVSDLSTGGGATLGQTVLVRIDVASGIGSATASFNCVVQ
jgi:hypothetical protein